MSEFSYNGILLIGDPHLSSRAPGFRKDDYPEVILAKLTWLLNVAQSDGLIPVILGDLFHWPRDNANWLVVRLMEVLANRSVLGITGNHDTKYRTLQEDDSLAILETAGSIRLIDRSGPWDGTVSGRPVLIGGSTWSSQLPTHVDPPRMQGEARPFTLWVAHHNIKFAGYEADGLQTPYEIKGVDVLVNGHIHTPSEGIVAGGTTWLNPGNIARVARGDIHRSRSPSAIRIDLAPDDWISTVVEVPHESFDDVFFPTQIGEGAQQIDVSAFVKGLQSIQTLKTKSGEGLIEFLETNLTDVQPRVSEEILSLAREVLNHEQYGDGD